MHPLLSITKSDIITVYLGNIRIDEPIVTLTDILISVLCFLYAYKLHKQKVDNRSIQLFKYYFIMMGIATFLGGVMGHAFLYLADSKIWKLPGWITSMFSIMLIERAVINHAGILFPKKVIMGLRIFNVIELVVFLALSVIYLEFFYVEFHSAYGLLVVVCGLEGMLYYKKPNKSSRNILIGLCCAGGAALVFSKKWGLHEWFNHLAVSHVFMAVATYFFYKSAKRMIPLKKVPETIEEKQLKKAAKSELA